MCETRDAVKTERVVCNLTAQSFFTIAVAEGFRYFSVVAFVDHRNLHSGVFAVSCEGWGGRVHTRRIYQTPVSYHFVEGRYTLDVWWEDDTCVFKETEEEVTAQSAAQ